MTKTVLTRQFIFDASGKPIAVLVPIDEYEALQRFRQEDVQPKNSGSRPSLYGALRHLGTGVASTEELDAARAELWSTWDRNDAS